MKNLGHILFIVPFFVLTAFTCETIEPESELILEKECFDSRQIKNDVMCAAIYQPVCGCDGKTYGNACEANAKGVLKFTEGQCH